MICGGGAAAGRRRSWSASCATFDLAAVSTRSWLGLLYLTTVGSLVGFTTYVWLLRVAPLPKIATYAYVNPVVAFVLAGILLGEAIEPRTRASPARSSSSRSRSSSPRDRGSAEPSRRGRSGRGALASTRRAAAASHGPARRRLASRPEASATRPARPCPTSRIEPPGVRPRRGRSGDPPGERHRRQHRVDAQPGREQRRVGDVEPGTIASRPAAPTADGPGRPDRRRGSAGPPRTAPSPSGGR